MEENKNKDIESIKQKELEEVSGGFSDPKGMFQTLEELETSPVFEKLKKWLGKYKRAGYTKTAPRTVYKLREYLTSLEYLINDPAAFGFIKKYWDLV